MQTGSQPAFRSRELKIIIMWVNFNVSSENVKSKKAVGIERKKVEEYLQKK